MRKLHTFRSIVTGEVHTKALSEVELRHYLQSFWNLRLVSEA